MAESINIKDVHYYITCPSCGANIGVSPKAAYTRKNCQRCMKGEFHITLVFHGGQITGSAYFEYNDRHTVVVAVENITVKDIPVK